MSDSDDDEMKYGGFDSLEEWREHFTNQAGGNDEDNRRDSDD
jgi:hypothetical protein